MIIIINPKHGLPFSRLQRSPKYSSGLLHCLKFSVLKYTHLLWVTVQPNLTWLGLQCKLCMNSLAYIATRLMLHLQPEAYSHPMLDGLLVMLNKSILQCHWNPRLGEMLQDVFLLPSSGEGYAAQYSPYRNLTTAARCLPHQILTAAALYSPHRDRDILSLLGIHLSRFYICSYSSSTFSSSGFGTSCSGFTSPGLGSYFVLITRIWLRLPSTYLPH